MTSLPPSQSERVCPRGETGCWWVVVGNPHSARGHGCICLIPTERWEYPAAVPVDVDEARAAARPDDDPDGMICT